MGLYDMPINNLNKLIASGAVQATEVVEDVFDRIEQVEGKVRAYLTLNKEAALQQARRIDEQVAHGEEIDPLAGVPVALKDNICTKGLRTTCAWCRDSWQDEYGRVRHGFFLRELGFLPHA
jgi:aspartyl-tRNA(Asn)/glutamyl-tRNA(Gln) amidotransferase subunit A